MTNKFESEIVLNLDKSKKYVLACSFGPDSMALFDMCIKNKINFAVAHVNYRKRDVSLFEQESLEKYCKKFHIKFYCLDLLGVEHKGNFQEWAREVRYKFFEEISKKTQADGVLVAHQEDDVIETYLMQKKRGNFVKNYGISPENEIFGLKIYRPLLGYSKEFLRQYDERNSVPYSIDESNLRDDYSRNKIRHHVVEKMSKKERQQIIEEIAKHKNRLIEAKTKFSSEEFCKLSYDQFVQILDFYMNVAGKHVDLSAKFFGEVKKAFSLKTNVYYNISDKIRLEKDYDVVYIVNLEKLRGYQYEFDTHIKTDFLDINFNNGLGSRKRGIILDKYIVKNLTKNESYIIKDYSVKINRIFVDWKMPHFLREIWPGIYSKNKELLYIPRYREKFEDKHDSKLNIDTEFFIKF